MIPVFGVRTPFLQGHGSSQVFGSSHFSLAPNKKATRDGLYSDHLISHWSPQKETTFLERFIFGSHVSFPSLTAKPNQEATFGIWGRSHVRIHPRVPFPGLAAKRRGEVVAGLHPGRQTPGARLRPLVRDAMDVGCSAAAFRRACFLFRAFARRVRFHGQTWAELFLLLLFLFFVFFFGFGFFQPSKE